MKPIFILVVALLAVAVAGWFAASRLADDETAPPAMRAAQPSPALGEASELDDARARKKIDLAAFPPVNEEARAAEGQAATLAMNGEHEKARREILRATALSGSVKPLGNFVATWYSEAGVGLEDEYLAYLLFAQSLNAKWATTGGLIGTLSRILGEEGTFKAQKEAAQMEQEYRAIKTSARGNLS